MKIASLIWEKERVSLLYPLLQKGAWVKVRIGGSVQSLLCEQLGLDPEYVGQRIQTAFLDGKPVDDFTSAKVAEGSVLALSGALPGLAGATLRRAGFFSPMRAALSHRGGAQEGQEREGFITVRIFNILLEELTPALLVRGVYVEKDEWDAFCRDLPLKDRENLEKKIIGEAEESTREGGETGRRVPAALIRIRTER